MLRVCVFLLVAGALKAASDPGDTLLRAMQDEVMRSKSLALNDLDKPYLITYTVDDGDDVAASASLGGLLNSSHVRHRSPHIRVRVGKPELDNTDSIFSVTPNLGALPTEDNYAALRTQFWLGTDAIYKTAVAEIGRKRTALREMADTEYTPDFAPAVPVQLVRPLSDLNLQAELWEGKVRRLSSRFARHPAITVSNVGARTISSTFRLADSAGSVVRVPENLGFIEVRASALAADGRSVRNHLLLTELDPRWLPDEQHLAGAVDAMADETEALARAPLAESYSGPVLFEGVAAGQMMAQVLAQAAVLDRRPLAPPSLAERVPRILESVWATRIGSPVTPDWLTVTDRPGESSYAGRALAGFYEMDEEGVAAKNVTLVDSGVLKGFLLTRQPVRTYNGSNGHGRLPGAFGAQHAALGNVFVEAKNTKTEEQLKKQLIERTKEKGQKYGLLIRQLDFPSTATPDQLSAIAKHLGEAGATHSLTAPLLAYRVYLDGHEELVRGLTFREFNAKNLRDLAGASNRSYVLNYLNNGLPYDWLDAPLPATTSSVICPSLLMEDVELDRAEEQLGKPPVVAPPALTASQ